MSKSKYIVCCAGNCSIWIMLYRGNCDNVYEYTNGKWIQPSKNGSQPTINPPPQNINVSYAKCIKKDCIYLRHTNHKNNGGTHCCYACKIGKETCRFQLSIFVLSYTLCYSASFNINILNLC